MLQRVADCDVTVVLLVVVVGFVDLISVVGEDGLDVVDDGGRGDALLASSEAGNSLSSGSLCTFFAGRVQKTLTFFEDLRRKQMA